MNFFDFLPNPKGPIDFIKGLSGKAPDGEIQHPWLQQVGRNSAAAIGSPALAHKSQQVFLGDPEDGKAFDPASTLVPSSSDPTQNIDNPEFRKMIQLWLTGGTQ